MQTYSFEDHEFYVLGRLHDPAPGCEEIAAKERKRAESKSAPIRARLRRENGPTK